MRHSPNFRNVIGTGGLNNDLKLWDLNTSKSIFEAKNVCCFLALLFNLIT